MSLEMCRLRADLIGVSKIVKGVDDVDQCSIFQPSSETRTRCHMFKKIYPLNARKFSFSQRVVSEWNSLPPKAVNHAMVKNIIDSIFRKMWRLHISQNRLSAPVLKSPSAFLTGGIQ